jgi:hypothetical protein
VLVHIEPSDGRHSSVLFICRERKYHSRQMKHVRTQTDQRAYRMLRKAVMRQLSRSSLIGSINCLAPEVAADALRIRPSARRGRTLPT